MYESESVASTTVVNVRPSAPKFGLTFPFWESEFDCDPKEHPYVSPSIKRFISRDDHNKSSAPSSKFNPISELSL